MEPTLPLKVVDVKVNTKKHAVYITIIFEDANHNLWEHRTSAFLFDLKEVR